MKILVLGCGYLGKAAVAHWIEKGHSVTACTRSSERVPELQRLTPYVKVLPKGSWAAVLQGQDVLLISVAPQAGESYRETYLETMQKVLQEAHSKTRILYTSSTSIYGDHAGRVVDEKTPPCPSSENSMILLRTEELLLSTSFNACIFRLGEIVGPSRMPWERIKKMEGRQFSGSGRSPVNLSPLPDCIAALTFALDRNLLGVYNLCHPFHGMRKDLYAKAAEAHHLPLPQWNPSQANPHAGDKIVSSAKIEALGFAFHTPESYFHSC